MLKKLKGYFSPGDFIIWGTSVALILASFFIFKGSDPLSLTTSLIGVTALLFCAKGSPIGQIIIIIFALLYGIISYRFGYYGEMLTYVCMSLPMAVLSLISWFKNPFKKGSLEVRVSKIKKRDIPLIAILAILVTTVFFFLLKYLGTANLIPSTFSVATSFVAVFLTYKRSPYYAAAYAVNDIVLIVLWSLASATDTKYLTVVFCFVAFLLSDLYTFICWRRMEKKQAMESSVK